MYVLNIYFLFRLFNYFKNFKFFKVRGLKYIIKLIILFIFNKIVFEVLLIWLRICRRMVFLVFVKIGYFFYILGIVGSYVDLSIFLF